MLALKCDNCGGYFNFGDRKDSNGTDFIHMDRSRNIELIDRMNLCPDCMAAVMKTLDDRRRRAVDPMEDDLK